MVRFHQLPSARGVLVASVEPGSPGERAGIKQSDVIVGFKGRTVGTIDELHKRLVASEIDVPSPVMIVRGTEKLFVVVTPRELRS